MIRARGKARVMIAIIIMMIIAHDVCDSMVLLKWLMWSGSPSYLQKHFKKDTSKLC